MLNCQRDFFSLPPNITYLNSASYSPLTKSAYHEGLRALRRKLAPWDVDPKTFPLEAEELRSLFATLIGAHSDDIAIINSTSYGIETAAKNLPVKQKGKIILLEDQFPSNVLSWQRLAIQKRSNIIFVKRPKNYDWTSAILEHLDETVSIASLPPCHWLDGSIIDLEKIGKSCRVLGIALVIDATQAIGAMPFDVMKIKPDFLTCSAYKWLLSPYTLGFLYAAPHRKQGTPLEFHRWNHGTPTSDVVEPTYVENFNAGARRYDMGEVNNFVNLPIAIKSLKQIIRWDPTNIANYLEPLVAEITKEAEKRGWSTPKKDFRASHYIGIKPGTNLPENVVTLLENENVFVSKRGNYIRVSPYLFNDSSDVEELFHVLDKVKLC